MIDFKNAAYLKLSPTSPSTYSKAVDPMLIAGEEVVACFQAIRDGVVFTNKRIIAINVQGITGKKADYTSLPYSKVQSYSIETAGTFDLDSELDVWFSGLGSVRFEFVREVNVAKLSTLISQAVL